jgi:hypothetical protein
MCARRKDEPKSSNGNTGGRVKFRYADADRYVDIDMEGANDAVAEGLKSLANALSGNPVLPVARRTALPVTPAQPAIPAPEPETPEATDYEPDEATADDETPEPAGNGDDKPKKKYVPKAPKFLSELDLTTASEPLADFIAKKNPTDTTDKYTVIAVWFKEHFNTEEVTADHIFTAYTALGWKAQMPEYPAQVLQDLKGKKHWFDKGSAPRTFKVNWAGISAVNKMGVAD